MNEDGHYRAIARAQLATDEDVPAVRDSRDLPSHMDRVRDPILVAAAKGSVQQEEQTNMEESP